MKQLKFDHRIAKQILKGEKTATFRIADDKDIRTGDHLLIVDKIEHDRPDTWQAIGEAVVTEAYEKQLQELDKADFTGHEPYDSLEDMVAVFRKFYGDHVVGETFVKVIRFAFTAYDEPRSYLQSNKSALPKEVLLYADGGSRGNPGPSALGYVICDPDTELVLVEGSKYLGITTNNQAEYQALRSGLEDCLKGGVRTVHVRMDSLLVVNQLKGIFKVKNRDLWPIYDAIKQMVPKFEEVSFTHVPRELNKKADAEVNKALDALKGV